MTLLTPEIHPLLSPLIVDVLNNKQIFTVLNLINTNIKRIINITRLTFKDVLQLRNDLLKKYSSHPINGFNYYHKALKHSAIIPTGIESLDKLLEGGLLTGNIYEMVGLPVSGKTHVCYTLVKNIIMNIKQNVYYLDTNMNFSGLKMKKMLENDIDEGDELFECLKRILVKRIETKFDLINSLYEIKSELKKKLNCRLIIIDSLPILVTAEMNKNNFLTYFKNIMHFIGSEYHVVFFIVNLLTKGIDIKLNNCIEQISCGKYWKKIPNTRVKIEKINQNYQFSILSIF